jgi:hypothetical protein
MTLPGECVNDTTTICHECGAELNIDIQKSAAGFYVGFWCPECGPYSRESGYYRNYEDAEKAPLALTRTDPPLPIRMSPPEWQ